MAKGLAFAALLALAPPAAQASPTDEARMLIGAPVFFEGNLRYGVIERVVRGRDGEVRTLLVRPDAPSSGVYALDWERVEVDPRTGAILMPDEAAQLATVPE